jgi:hypothetical protein
VEELIVRHALLVRMEFKTTMKRALIAVARNAIPVRHVSMEFTMAVKKELTAAESALRAQRVPMACRTEMKQVSTAEANAMVALRHAMME